MTACFQGSLDAQLSVSPIFSDQMVLQRNEPIRIWGTAGSGQTVELEWQGEAYTAKSSDTGNWMVELPPLPAGGPFRLKVRSGSEMVERSDIWLGDVWLCSGQSNMEWTVANAQNADREIAAAGDPMIRHFPVDKTYAEAPETKLEGGPWQVASPGTVGSFTAVGYFFARELRESIDVPIGLLHSSWGGSRIEAWMSARALGLENAEETIRELRKAEAQAYRKRLDHLLLKFPELTEYDRGMEGENPVWAQPDLKDTNWMEIQVPGLWEEQGFQDFDGIGWYRSSFVLSEEEANNSIQLHLGKIDDSDETWVNGHPIGATQRAWNEHRFYTVAADHLRAGKNSLVIRVEDTGGGGGIHGASESIYLESYRGIQPLAGVWKFKPGAVASPAYTGSPHQTPTLLYNKMIHPLLPFPIKGVLWYQGESNADNTEDAERYAGQFQQMIRSWRARWGLGNFPFLFVQLANFMAAKDEPAESDWAILRESQTKALELPHTGQAVIIDLGEADDIHPRNKQDVGLRLALAARAIAYDEDIVYSGPVVREARVREGKVVILFDHIGAGLRIREGQEQLGGFALAGKDEKFVWANARIDEEQVVVWSEKVSEPKFLRYAWADNPEQANLYNAEGLPAGPFRLELE